MWNLSNRERNSYLQKQIHTMNPLIINQCVDEAWQELNSILPKQSKVNSQLVSAEPECFGPTIERFKARLAYGLDGLPKILREISSKDSNIQCKALYRLIDLLSNPLEYYRAVNDFNVVRKLEACLMRSLPESPVCVPVIDKILRNFELIAMHFDGAWRMVSQIDLNDSLYCLIEKSICFKDLPAKVLQFMSLHPTVADVMINHGDLKRIEKILKRICPIKDFYIHLSHLIQRAPDLAFDLGFYNLLVTKIHCKNQFQAIICKNFALLLNCYEAQIVFEKSDGVAVLYDMLKDEELQEDVLENVVMALKNLTNIKTALLRCREFWDLPLMLLRRAHSRNNDILQLYSLEALRQISIVPSIKNFLRKTCKKQIYAIESGSELVEKCKKHLIEWLKKKPYINIKTKEEYEEYEECEDEFDDVKGNAEKLPIESETEESEIDFGDEIQKSSEISVSGESESVKEKFPIPSEIIYKLNYGNICWEKSSTSSADPDVTERETKTMAPVKSLPELFKFPDKLKGKTEYIISETKETITTNIIEPSAVTAVNEVKIADVIARRRIEEFAHSWPEEIVAKLNVTNLSTVEHKRMKSTDMNAFFETMDKSVAALSINIKN